MKPRCTGAKTPGHWTGFECVLDDGDGGFCEPYVAPTVAEWRQSRNDLSACLRSISVRTEQLRQGFATLGEFAAEAFCRAYNDVDRARASVERNGLALAACSAEDESKTLRAENARLQAEFDALRAILASGCDACAHAAPKHPVSQEATLAEMRGLLDDDEPERTDP